MRDFQFNSFDTRHHQQIGNLLMAASQPLVLFNAQQHMRRLAAIRDKHRAVVCGFLSPAGILIKLTAGQGCDGYGPNLQFDAKLQKGGNTSSKRDIT